MAQNNRSYWHDDPEREGRLAFTLYAQAKGLAIGWDELSLPNRDYWTIACGQTLSPRPLAAELGAYEPTLEDL